MKKILLFGALLLLPLSLLAQLRIANPFADGMVLQQQSEAALWGEATPGAEVEVVGSWGAEPRTVKADRKGHWHLNIPTPRASYTPYEVVISSGEEQLTLRDVLIGEVWLASGQSNMEMPMRGFYNCPVEGSLEEYAQPARREKIRMYSVQREQSYTPSTESHGRWLQADAAQVPEMSATAYFFAKRLNAVLDVPVGVLLCAYGGAKVESWMPREILEKYPDVDLTREGIEAVEWEYWRPMMAYNAMLYPLQGYTIKGFIWYQGCSNVQNYEFYADRFAAMVSHWRGLWGDSEAKLPFYSVEIAPYRYKSGSEVCRAAELRAAQHATARVVPNSAVVVTNDLVESYEIDNIHPAKKAPVGNRLAYLALNRDYGYSTLPCYSPEALRIERRSRNEVAIYFSHMPNGINRWMEIEGLEVAGSEGVFVPVRYAYYEWEPQALVIRSEFVFDPLEVRYGWGDFCPGNLASAEGLPIAPFRLRIAE